MHAVEVVVVAMTKIRMIAWMRDDRDSLNNLIASRISGWNLHPRCPWPASIDSTSSGCHLQSPAHWGYIGIMEKKMEATIVS